MEKENSPVIALTFDDGPNTTTTAEILRLIEKHNITATFFLIGSNINSETAEVVKKAYDMGCEIENHSRSHSYMDKMTELQIKDEVDSVSDSIRRITGEPARFFRPPYIAVSEGMFRAVSMPFICGFGCNDWDDAVSCEERINAVLDCACDGAVILLHDSEGNEKTVKALEVIIPELLSREYRFVTINGLFKEKNIIPSCFEMYSKL